MEFDKSKVYTAVNADEVKVGSKGYFADTIAGLKNNIDKENILTVGKVWEEDSISRFQTSGGLDYLLFYLAEEPAEYRPYENAEEMIEDFKERARANGGSFTNNPMFHPSIWVKENDGEIFQVLRFDEKEVYTWQYVSFEDLLKDYTYLDGSPCGKEIK